MDSNYPLQTTKPPGTSLLGDNSAIQVVQLVKNVSNGVAVPGPLHNGLFNLRTYYVKYWFARG